jgi:hypothetical protein
MLEYWNNGKMEKWVLGKWRVAILAGNSGFLGR